MNAIPGTQNTPRHLEQLAAQRELYSEAKIIQAVEMISALLPPLLLLFALLIGERLYVYAALLGCILAVLDVALWSPLQKKKRQAAAIIQELFDCEVFGMPWNSVEAGQRPTPELVAKYAEKYNKKVHKGSPIDKWYSPDIGALPLPLARVACQRSNIVWDLELRRRYVFRIAFLLSFLTVGVVVLALVRGLTVEGFLLSIVLPLVPAYVVGLQQIFDQREAMVRLDRLLDHATRLWDNALEREVSEATLDQESRRLQDQIFSHRAQTPTIFDWIYKRLRGEQERLMYKGIEDLVEEARKRGRV